MISTTILVAIVGLAVSGLSGYFLSYRFWRSAYSATNKSGDFGSPRGGFFAMMSGVLIGMLFFSFLGQYLFPPETIGTGMIVSMIGGAVAGMIGMFRGTKNRPPAPDKDKEGEGK